MKWLMCSIVWWGLAAGAPGPACADGITVDQVIEASTLIDKIKSEKRALESVKATKADVLYVYGNANGALLPGGCNWCSTACSGCSSTLIATLPWQAVAQGIQTQLDDDIKALQALGVK
jgi:hypothetical protein